MTVRCSPLVTQREAGTRCQAGLQLVQFPDRGSAGICGRERLFSRAVELKHMGRNRMTHA